MKHPVWDHLIEKNKHALLTEANIFSMMLPLQILVNCYIWIKVHLYNDWLLPVDSDISSPNANLSELNEFMVMIM
jgi:hypothetical protein